MTLKVLLFETREEETRRSDFDPPASLAGEHCIVGMMRGNRENATARLTGGGWRMRVPKGRRH